MGLKYWKYHGLELLLTIFPKLLMGLVVDGPKGPSWVTRSRLAHDPTSCQVPMMALQFLINNHMIPILNISHFPNLNLNLNLKDTYPHFNVEKQTQKKTSKMTREKAKQTLGLQPPPVEDLKWSPWQRPIWQSCTNKSMLNLFLLLSYWSHEHHSTLFQMG